MLMENVVLDGGPGQGYRSLITGGDNSQLEDLKVSSHTKESASKVRKCHVMPLQLKIVNSRDRLQYDGGRGDFNG
jgi:hypothetical protein